MKLTPLSPRVMAWHSSHSNSAELGLCKNRYWWHCEVTLDGFHSFEAAVLAARLLGWEVGEFHPINESSGSTESRRAHEAQQPYPESAPGCANIIAGAGVAPSPEDADARRDIERSAQHRPLGEFIAETRRKAAQRDYSDPEDTSMVEPTHQPHGCICPPNSEATCQGALCPRRAVDTEAK